VATPCYFNVQCLEGVCEGENAATNLRNFHNFFFKYLLEPKEFEDVGLADEVQRLLEEMESLSLSTEQVLKRFDDLLKSTS
jgi:hypothetical protein